MKDCCHTHIQKLRKTVVETLLNFKNDCVYLCIYIYVKVTEHLASY